MASTRVVSGDFVHIEGLAEFRSALKMAERKFPTVLRKANSKVAKRVALEARGTAFSQGSVAAKTAPSIKWGASTTLAHVKLGGPRAPYALGAEFGALQYPQFKPWRGNGPDAGHFLFPTIRRMAPRIRETYLDEVVDAVSARAFPQVSVRG